MVDVGVIANFKLGMRCLASTVCIVTTADADDWFGMIATAVCSVGAEPPSLLVSIAHTASLHEPASRLKRFCVNVLRTDHHELVGPFSGMLTGMARFARGEWKIDAHVLPFLDDAQAVFFCSVQASLDYANHGILVGRVEDVRLHGTIDPLLYRDGALAVSRPHLASRSK